jgi:hypothetical protein
VIAGVRYREHTADARRRGITPYLWLGPSHWTPAEWRTTLPFIERRAREVGARGIGVDIENGWPGLGGAERRAIFRELGRELGRIVDSGLEVIVTSFPSLPDIEVLAAAAPGKLQGNAQVYGISAQDEASFERWVAKWRVAFGEERTSLSFAAEPWGRNAWLGQPGAFSSYLHSLPGGVSAAVAWYEGTAIPPAFQQEINAWNATRSYTEGMPAWVGPVLGGLAAVAVVAGVWVSRR